MTSHYHYRESEFDADGFLMNPAHWDEGLAREIASHDGIAELTEEHMAVIRCIRERYLGHGALPHMRHVFHMNHLDDDCYNTLFGHSTREAWRIAGLPNPGEEARAYLS